MGNVKKSQPKSGRDTLIETSMLRQIIFFIASLFLTEVSFGQTSDFKIVTQDVNNFWEAVDSLKNNTDTVQVFQSLVLNRATKEFQIFINKWNIKAKDYAYQLRQFPNFYKTLRQNTNRLINSEDSIRRVINQFKNIYPNFKPADICIALGNFKTGGNIEITKNGQYVYVGLEYHGLDTSTFIKELSLSTQDYVSRSNFFRTIIHELVHVQQYTHGKKVKRAFYGNVLIKRVLGEGIPDFIAQLICSQGNNGNYFDYGIKNENTLKNKLKSEMFLATNGNWFGEGKSYNDIPRDLGYFMGSRIARSFYLNKHLTKKAITDLIEIKDLEKFVVESKYFDEL